MLGDQFRNTYAYDGPRGGARYYSPTSEGELRDSGRPLNRNYQGMLFSPHEATETDLDPSVDKEARRSLIRETFGLSGLGTDAHDLGESIARTGLPNHVIRGIENPPRMEARSLSDMANGTYERDKHLVTVDADLNRRHQGETAIHELGHALHLQGKDSVGETRLSGSGGDELLEGVADGYADRYASHAHQFPEALHRDGAVPARRVLELKRGRGQIGGSSGYGAESPAFRGGTVGRALYAAQRQKVALTGEMPRPTEKTSTYVETSLNGDKRVRHDHETREAQRLVLGRMSKTDPMVRETVTALGRDHVEAAISAEQMYTTRSDRRRAQDARKSL